MTHPDHTSAAAKRQARAIRILTCLQSGPNFNAQELARRLRVSRRTIYRDLNLIREAGIPVKFDDEHSAYRITRDARSSLAPPDLEPHDLTRLALTSHLSLLHGFADFGMAVRESTAKLLGNYPSEVRNPICRLLSCCEVEVPRPKYSAKTMEIVEQIFDAISRRSQIRLAVRDPGGFHDGHLYTKLSPYRVLIGLEHWSVEGRSSYHRATTRFRVDHIEELELTSESYRIPRGFRSRKSSAIA